MRRLGFGIAAVFFLIAGCYFWWRSPRGAEIWVQGAAVRIGLVLTAIWLAYPELKRIPGWLSAVLLIAFAVVAIRPRLVVVVAPAIFAIWILRPRQPKSKRST